MVIRILNFSKYHIDAWVNDLCHSRITLFYGSPSANMRRQSWILLRNLASLNVTPWIIFGDFNEVCFSWEIKGNKIRGEWQMRQFREVVEESNLYDLGFQGHQYTFSNRRMGSWETKARLDRAMACGDWIANFPKANVDHINTPTSDHSLLLIDFCVNTYTTKLKSFRFEPM